MYLYVHTYVRRLTDVGDDQPYPTRRMKLYFLFLLYRVHPAKQRPDSVSIRSGGGGNGFYFFFSLELAKFQYIHVHAYGHVATQ